MKHTALRGHALMHEGNALVPQRLPGYYRMTYRRRGVGYCECGAESPELPSTAARKRWHAEHKDRIRNPENWTYKGVKP